MNLSWSNRVIKYILFVFNLVFVITGIILIAVGVSVKSYYKDYDIILSDNYFSLPNLLIAIGSLIFFISFFGCCGAIRESWFMIFIFSVLLSIIFIMEFSAGIAGYVLRDKTTSYLTEKLEVTMKHYNFNGKEPKGYTYMWDKIQSTFECCGASDPWDWSKVPRLPPNPAKLEKQIFNPSTEDSIPLSTESLSASTESSTPPSTESSSASTESSSPSSSTDPSSTTVSSTVPTSVVGPGPEDSLDLPFSCCKSNPGATGTVICRLNSTDTATYYDRGCIYGFGDYLKEHAVTLGGLGLAIAFIQLVGVIFACHLTKQLKHGFYST